jgi:hypothetical protein
MENPFEQTKDFVQKTWEPWRELVTKPIWFSEVDDSLLKRWIPIVETMRTSCETGISAWNSVAEKSEQMFFKMLKGSPFHNEALESQLHTYCDQTKKAQTVCQDILKENLEKVEGMLKKKPEKPSAVIRQPQD